MLSITTINTEKYKGRIFWFSHINKHCQTLPCMWQPARDMAQMEHRNVFHRGFLYRYELKGGI